LEDDAALALKAYAWPGNVRELENVMERAVVLAEGPQITLSELPPELLQSSTMIANAPSSGSPPITLYSSGDAAWSARFEEEERQRLIQAMAQAGGNKSQAARVLGIPRSTFVSKMEKHGLLPRRV